ncbi:threonine/homoserine/homoserine lactone efflux protein [Rhizobium tibeticum]|uniref:LysE family translocator n=1 Tax=Rhizobium tibeticum TaxID=501024 RepID=UPI00277F4664|nr:threonine transporter RhtB [Rhizobium tibeticum]MDP9813550.1 threonine/homoserine/homoserine lactone efflux protein [Rhizobium tibeticum]
MRYRRLGTNGFSIVTLSTFIPSVFAILVLPGPTNTLLALASQGGGLSRAVVLFGTVIASYLAVVIPVSLFASPFLATHPTFTEAVKLVSAAWVLYLALKLWRGEPGTSTPYGMVPLRDLVVTTLLNPKAIIIALTMVAPIQGVLRATAIMSFSAIVFVTSAIWLSIGRALLAGDEFMSAIVSRCGMAVLFVFSAVLAASAVS